MHVSLAPGRPPAGRLTSDVLVSPPTDIDDGLRLAADWSPTRADSTRDLWEALATLGALDLGFARAVEPHWDAMSILRQAGVDVPAGAGGVFAAEGGDDPLTIDEDGLLRGTKLWCSLADRLDFALVTAAGGLYLVDLKQEGVHPEFGAWRARGLSEIPSGPVRFDGVAALPIGEPGWYLQRPGFAWGGIAVAACWFGGAVGVARAVHAAAVAKPNPFLLMHLGAIDRELEDARRALAEAAELIDTDDPQPKLLAKRVRATVARACEDVLERAGHALGPAPLALDAAHAKRVADLQLYVRQHHAERDLASLGETIAARTRPW